jgi:nitroimidazol reductase NimA-like FMN-containing flavoprotein (pyridoxamine 5'-phosphate oxidase superfamily)
MTSHVRPIVRALDDDESRALLTRNRVGRIAWCQDGRVDVEPIHFVHVHPWIFARTRASARVLTLPAESWCAFEVDAVAGMWDWSSVVVKGPLSVAGSAGATWDHDVAVAALRRLLPVALTVYDPTPARDVVFAIHVSEISGRCSISNGAFEGEPVGSGG